MTLRALDVPLSWTGVDGSQTVSVEARWNLNHGDVYGVGGSLKVGGSADFKGVSMNGFTAAAAFGQFENYFVARGNGGGKSGGGVGFTAGVGLFAGHSCKPEPLLLADPLAGELIKPPESFSGVYLNYGGKVPLTELAGIPSTCLLRLDGLASTSLYYDGGTGTGRIGGRQKLGAEGEVLCVLEVDVSYALFLELDASARLTFGGQASVGGRVGSCPLCLEKHVDITIKGVLSKGGVDYFIDY